MAPSFADLGVPLPLQQVLTDRGVAQPFPIQAATLPDALAGRDVCGRAPTGSGKTLAFGLAIANHVRPARRRHPTVLVLVPTRELASQVAREIEALSGYHGQTVATLYGGTSYGPQRKALHRGAEVVVACPGRLEDLVQQGDVHLDDVDLVVLDEADRMADMGFLPAVRRLLDRTSADRQTLLFSATLDDEIDVLVRRYQTDPARHEVAADEGEVGDVSHRFWLVERSERVNVTAGLVRRHGRAIVFCRTRHGVDRLIKQLGRIGVDARGVHGNRTQSQRERALAAFTGGRVEALVATDVAARGIHVDDVGCVVHFDLPADSKDYVHRSGRTGRAGADGSVVSLVLDDLRKDARALQRALGVAQGLDHHDLPADLLRAAPRPAGGGNGADATDAGSPGGGGGRGEPGRNGGRRRGRRGNGGRQETAVAGGARADGPTGGAGASGGRAARESRGGRGAGGARTGGGHNPAARGGGAPQRSRRRGGRGRGASPGQSRQARRS